MSGFVEADYENSLIELFQNMEYQHLYGPDVVRDYNSPLYDAVLDDSLRRINTLLPDAAIEDALYRLKNFENGTIVQKNTVFMNYLQNGIEVSYHDNGETKSDIVYIVDYDNPDNNSFIVANQWTYIENSEKRPDILLFLNGIPVVLIELKSPSREDTDASEGYLQIRNYMHEIPSMFTYNAICVMSDMSVSKAGTITSGEDRYMEWKTKDGDKENTQYAQFDTFFEGMFGRERLLDLFGHHGRQFPLGKCPDESRWREVFGLRDFRQKTGGPGRCSVEEEVGYSSFFNSASTSAWTCSSGTPYFW